MRWMLLLLIPLAFGAAANINVVVQGADESLADNIRNHLGELAETQRGRSLHSRLVRAVENASQALGYYQTTFSYAFKGNEKGERRLFLQIEPGPRLRWGPPTLEVTGPAASVGSVEQLLNEHPFKAGTPVDQPSYDRYKARLLDRVLEEGFLDAEYRSSRLLLDPQEGTGRPILVLESGPRYRFGSIAFTGTRVAPELLQRLVPFRTGSDFARSDIQELYRRFQDSLYFRSIGVRTEPQPDGTVAIEVTLEDAPRHRLATGVGFGTDTGPRLRLRWERPAVNSAGHRFTTEARLSAPYQEASAAYRVPLQRPLWQSLNFTAAIENRDIEDTESTIASLGAFYADRLGDYWYTSIGATLENEQYRQGSAPERNVTYLIPAWSINGMNAPEISDPLRGHRTWMTLAGSDPALGAETAFLRATLGRKQILHLGNAHLLLARAEIGILDTADIDRVPASQRFFTGGDQTVRGYDFESLSSRDANGELRGGRYLNVASLEYSFKVRPAWRLATFVDAGRAYLDDSEPWHTSVGIGVRWLSPVGQIRVDLAAPVGDDSGGFRIHVFMGPPL